jgi:outer membrane lipoprotein SlyB
MRTTKLQSALAHLVTAVACMLAMQAHAQSGVYANSQVHSVGAAEEGVVLQVSITQVQASWQSRAGVAAVGGVVGTLVGDSLGSDYQTKAVLRTLGAIAGGLAAERAADQLANTEAQEIVIGLFNPSTKAVYRVVTIVQPAPYEHLAANDKVLLVTTNGTARVIKANYDLTTFQK